ncbi:MAG: hypothetical protein P1P88_03550 [Bacteroidales bacterium]|nr:hypothetical protein [Bacteroidales bacterium]
MKIIAILLVVILQLQVCSNKEESEPISKNVKIEFRLAEDDALEGFEESEVNGQKIYLNPKIEITENDIVAAQKAQDDYGNHTIMLEMNEKGSEKFGELTENNIQKKLAIIVNGKVLMAPVIQMKIPGGKIQISGNFSKEEIEKLYNLLTEERK